MIKVIIFLFISAYTGSAFAEIYKWVDANGKVHYGDRPVTGQKAEELHLQSNVPEVNTSKTTMDNEELTREEKRQRVLDAMTEDRQAKEDDREKQKIEAANKKERCNQLKDRARRVAKASGLYRLDKNGERVYVSKDDRKKSEADLRSQIKKHCS